MSSPLLKKYSTRLQLKSKLPNFFDHVRFHEKHIVSYDAEYLFSYGFFINPKASVLSRGMLFRCLVMCCLGTFVSQMRCEGTSKDHRFCFPVMPPAEGLIFASLVSFLLGMFQSSTFARWWSCREKLTTIVNNTMMMTLLLQAFVTSKEPEVIAITGKMKRWMHLAHGLVYKQADLKFDLKDLIDSGTCTPAEAEQILKATKANMPSLVYAWVMDKLRQLIVQAKTIKEGESAMLACITNNNSATGELMGLLRTQMPYPYLHLLTLITKVHCVFIAFYAGGIIAQGIVGYAWTRILFGYVVIIANNLMYEGLLSIHSVLVNPCGDDVGDFPTSLFWKTTINTCNSVLSLPLPMTPEPESFTLEEEDDESYELETHPNGTITLAL